MLQEAAASDAGSGSSKRSDRHLAGLLLIPTPQSVLRKRSSWRQSGFNGMMYFIFDTMFDYSCRKR